MHMIVGTVIILTAFVLDRAAKALAALQRLASPSIQPVYTEEPMDPFRADEFRAIEEFANGR